LNSTRHLQIDRIRRGKWVVLVLGLIAAIVAFTAVHAQPTTYTGWATLTTGSANRAPEQDGVLSSGYVDFFNNIGYQDKLKASAKVPADVELHAKTAASSPIIYIEATSVSSRDAAAGAASAAEAFRDEINAQLRAAQDDAIAALRKPFDDARQANGVVSQLSFEQLQDRINDINADMSNKLFSLGLQSGVTQNSPDRPIVLLALIGGCVVGCVVVVVWSAILSRRLPTGGELAAKVGLSPIVEVPAAGSERSRRLRARRFQQLVNAVSLANLPDPATLTVTSTVASGGCMQVARALAEGRAAQGVRTVLINADLNKSDGVGFGDIISDESVDLHLVLKSTRIPRLAEMTSGRTTTTPFAAITYQRLTSLLLRLADRAECVVIAAPPIADAAETQILCAAVDGVLMVVDSSVSRVQDTAESVTLLQTTTSKLLGTVLIDGSAGDSGDLQLGAGGVGHSEVTTVARNGHVPAGSTVVMGGAKWRGPSSGA
jgi:tyrosine-protein kinase Etk/Wzc